MRKSILLTALLSLAAGYGAGYRHWQPADGGLEAVAAVDSAARYVCPMHANIVADHPDHCPVCGMELVPARRPDEAEPELEPGGSGPAALPVVNVEPAVVYNLGVRTATATRGDLPRRIETIGKITRIDPMARRTLSPPIRGELVYVADKQQGDFIDDGELLFSVKSDELFEHEKSFQDAYLSGDRATAAAMVPQLSRMGLSSAQIARLQAGAAPELPVEVRAFEDGIVYTRRGAPGEAVHTGFTVFNVGGNYRVVDVTAEIFERQWGWVEEGQKAYMEVRGLPGVRFEGSVVRVEPPVGYTTRSLEVGLRFRSDNPALSQSMFAHVTLVGQPRRGVLLVPADAVIRTGRGDRVVKVLEAGRYQPVPVVAGEQSGGLVEIRSGLSEGDRVVASGQFLIDSESNIQAGFRRMATPGTAPVQEARQHDVAPPPAAPRPAPPASPGGEGKLPVSAPSPVRPPPPV